MLRTTSFVSAATLLCSSGFAALSVIVAGLLWTAVANADDPVDTVTLANGGHLRGVVLEQSPKTGITIRLVDGTTRKLKPAEVATVDYDDEPSDPGASPLLSQAATVDGSRGTLRVEAHEPGVVFVDGRAVGSVPLQIAWLPAGEHRIVVRFAAGGSREDVILVQPGKTVTLVSLRQAQQVAPPAMQLPGVAPREATPAEDQEARGNNGDPDTVRLRGIELGLSFFETSAFGSAQSGIAMDPAYGATYGIGLDAGYRIDNHFYIGLFGYGACVDCGGIASLTFGTTFRVHTRPATTVDPWVGLGLSFEDSGATKHGAAGYEGWNAHIDTSIDFKPVPAFAVGPFLDLSVGEYTSVDPETPSDSSTVHGALHGWVVFGIRSAYDIRF